MQIDPMITTGSPPPPEKKTRKEKKLCVGRRVVGLGRRDRKLENQDRTTLETSRSDYGDSHRPSPSEETDRSNIEPQLFSDMSKWTPFFFFFFFFLSYFFFSFLLFFPLPSILPVRLVHDMEDPPLLFHEPF